MLRVTGPKAQATDHFSAWVFNLNTVRSPLHWEADLGSCPFFDIDRLLTDRQQFFIVVIAPTTAIRIIPIVITALANQTHLQLLSSQFLTLCIGQHQFKFWLTLGIHFFTLENATNARQLRRWPHRLHNTTGDWTAGGLQNTGLYNQIQRRLALWPLAVNFDLGVTLCIEDQFIQINFLFKRFIIANHAKLKAWQAADRFAQRPYIQLTGDAITRGRCAIQITTLHRHLQCSLRFNRCRLGV